MTIRTLFFYLIVSPITLLFVLPLWWFFAGSLRKPGLPPPQTLEWWPSPIHWMNFQTIFELVDLRRFVLNSLLVALIGVAITLVTASWAGFAAAQMSASNRRRFVMLAVLVLMVPVTALWLTRFLLFKELGLINTHAALIAPSLLGTSALFVLLFYWTFRRVPVEMFESARLDGASALRIWAQIGLPLARPTAVAVAVLAFVHYWSDFIDPLLYLKSERLYTLAVGLRMLQQLDVTNWPLLMAGAVVMTLPVLISYFLLQTFTRQEGRLAGIFGR